MKYAYEIISLIGWPVLIYISYKLSMFFIQRFEERSSANTREETPQE
jgi:hypothetical protein